MFSEGVCFWLDIQWYLHQALSKAGTPWDRWTAVVRQDLALLLERLPGLEQLAWSDGSPFADDVTRNWIAQQVMPGMKAWLAGGAAHLWRIIPR
jgi:type VI secretion system protein VasJ